MAIQLQVKANGRGFSEPWKLWSESRIATKTMCKDYSDMKQENEYSVRFVDTKKNPELKL